MQIVVNKIYRDTRDPNNPQLWEALILASHENDYFEAFLTNLSVTEPEFSATATTAQLAFCGVLFLSGFISETEYHTYLSQL